MKGPPEGDPLNLHLSGLLRRVRNSHDRQAFCLRLLPEVQRDSVAAEEYNPRRRELVVQHFVIALERCRPPVRGPARIEARLCYPACPGPPSRDHLRPVLATLVAEENLLVAVLFDPFANLVERVEDHIDICPVGGSSDDQGHP